MPYGFWNSMSSSKSGNHSSSHYGSSGGSPRASSAPAYKLKCLRYKENYNMWCSVNPCENCLDYSINIPHWCFAGSIRSYSDKGKQCDLSDLANNPICRGCLVKIGMKNNWIPTVQEFFKPTSDNFNYLYTVKDLRKDTKVFLWGNIVKEESTKTYTASKFGFEESKLLVFSKKDEFLTSKPFELVRQRDEALSCSEKSDQEITWPDDVPLEDTQSEKDCDEMYEACLTDEQIEERHMEQEGDDFVREFEIQKSYDAIYYRLESTGVFEIAKNLGIKYVDFGEDTSLEIWECSEPPVTTVTPQATAEEAFNSFQSTLSAIPDSMTRTAVVKDVIARLVNVIA